MKSKTDLISAAKKGELDAVKRLLRCKVNPNMRDKTGWTALHWASQEGFLAIVKALVGDGADLNAADTLGFTPLALACGSGHLGVVRQLLASGADPNKRIVSDGNGTVLHLACSWGRGEIVRVLCDTPGIKLNLRDREDKTALGCAIEAKEAELVGFLRGRGARI